MDKRGAKDTTALDAMEKIESIIELWQKGDINSEDALEQITTLTDEL